MSGVNSFTVTWTDLTKNETFFFSQTFSKPALILKAYFSKAVRDTGASKITCPIFTHVLIAILYASENRAEGAWGCISRGHWRSNDEMMQWSVQRKVHPTRSLSWKGFLLGHQCSLDSGCHYCITGCNVDSEFWNTGRSLREWLYCTNPPAQSQM